jgi:hypothetical protein
LTPVRPLAQFSAVPYNTFLSVLLPNARIYNWSFAFCLRYSLCAEIRPHFPRFFLPSLRDGVNSCLHVQTTSANVPMGPDSNLIESPLFFTRTNDGGLRAYRGHQDAAGIWISQNPSIRFHLSKPHGFLIPPSS